VNKFFSGHSLAKLASSSELSLAKSENNWPKYRKSHGGPTTHDSILIRAGVRSDRQEEEEDGEGEKSLARLANGFVFLLANPEFHSHLAS
jgi:hypothetical protein